MKIPNLRDEIEKDENAVQKAEELKEQKKQESKTRFESVINSYADYIKQSEHLKVIYDDIRDSVYESFTKSIKMGFFHHTQYDRLTHIGYSSPRVQDELNFTCSISDLEYIKKIGNNFNYVVSQLYDEALKELLQENDIEYKDIDVTWDYGYNEFKIKDQRYLLFRRKVQVFYELKRINIACTSDKANELYKKFLGTSDRIEVENIHMKARENMKRQDKLND
jgi:hypothetical protein